MDTALTVLEPLALPTELTAPLKLAADFAKASKAPATQAAYKSDFEIFRLWCAARGISALPATAAALCGFLADEAAAGKRASTLGRRLAAIRYFHRAAGYDTPTGDEKVKAVLSGIRRTIGAAPVRKRAATSDMVIAMSATGTSLRALRDRAIILVGFAGAFRRSELVALDVEDLEEAPEGLLITIRRSKTDQEGIGRKGLSLAARSRARSRRCEHGSRPRGSPRALSSVVSSTSVRNASRIGASQPAMSRLSARLPPPSSGSRPRPSPATAYGRAS
jgi:integrase